MVYYSYFWRVGWHLYTQKKDDIYGKIFQEPADGEGLGIIDGEDVGLTVGAIVGANKVTQKLLICFLILCTIR